jgi:hypothetical protein
MRPHGAWLKWFPAAHLAVALLSDALQAFKVAALLLFLLCLGLLPCCSLSSQATLSPACTKHCCCKHISKVWSPNLRGSCMAVEASHQDPVTTELRIVHVGLTGSPAMGFYTLTGKDWHEDLPQVGQEICPRCRDSGVLRLSVPIRSSSLITRE